VHTGGKEVMAGFAQDRAESPLPSRPDMVLHIGVAEAPLCNLPLIYTTFLSGADNPASRYHPPRFYLSTRRRVVPSPEKRCYQSQLFILHRVSRVVYVKRAFTLTIKCIVNYPFTFNKIWYKVIDNMGFLKHSPGKAGDTGSL
jgi:hypothetical protein